MHIVSPVLKMVAIAAGIASVGFAARADDFLDACTFNTSDPSVKAICACMSNKITGAGRPDAITAMRRLNESLATGGAPIDPKMLPANVMKALSAVVAAQADCM